MTDLGLDCFLKDRLSRVVQFDIDFGKPDIYNPEVRQERKASCTIVSGWLWLLHGSPSWGQSRGGGYRAFPKCIQNLPNCRCITMRESWEGWYHEQQDQKSWCDCPELSFCGSLWPLATVKPHAQTMHWRVVVWVSESIHTVAEFHLPKSTTSLHHSITVFLKVSWAN